jgi:predicted NBD/HSP70 family sugar kinase
VFELVDALIAKAGSPLLGIGIGTPGLVDAPRGVVRKAVNLEWQDLPLSDLLAARYQLPVYIANDSHVAALGEYTFGRYHNLTNLVVVKVGRGISAGLVLNGRLYYGDGSGAGEIGHVVLVENGEPCMCGHCGCLETLVSSRAIIRQAREIARQNPQSLLNQLVSRPEAITTGIARQAFDMGDPDLEAVIENVGRYLGIAVAQLIGVVNIETVVIAGSVAQFGPKLLESIRREMQRRAMEMLARPTQVKLSELGQNIVVQGAAALLLANELGIV